MSRVAIKGGATGTATYTLEAPAGSTDRTLVLPDEAGTVLTTSTGYSFRATMSSDRSMSGGTWTKLLFNTEDFDTGGAYDATNSKFVVPTGGDGAYLFTYTAGISQNLSNTETIILNPYVNGVRELSMTNRQWGNGTNGRFYFTTTQVINLTAGDYVEAYIYQESGGTATCEANRANFAGFKIL